MGRTWILHTETKGTGAQMVPLDAVTERRRATEPVFVPRGPAQPPEPEQPKPRPTHRFRIVDVMTRQALVDDGSAREAIGVLGDVRSLVDVNVYVWSEEDERWRLLTFAEQRAMSELARGQFQASEERASQ
jgi:hypothetical protein